MASPQLVELNGHEFHIPGTTRNMESYTFRKGLYIWESFSLQQVMLPLSFEKPSHVSSTLFVYKPSQDSVLQVSKEDYDNCNTGSPIAKFEDGNTSFNLKLNCRNNEKLTAIVLSDRSKTPPPSPHTPPPSSPPPPPPSSPPATIPSPAPAGEEFISDKTPPPPPP
ncbi:hypothetical protein MKW94_028840 [Papaver nudicaule]|uniref:Phytocyanin domain-containing protein n=1 Tax=Papaver nudicaule TaxID=74823 RepID=A0AA42B266_PAPNU|nr:hypothetical protein [Papaver nudicaule]